MENEGKNNPLLENTEFIKGLGSLGDNLEPFLKTEIGKAIYDVAKYHIQNGVKTFEEFSKKVIDDFGDLIKPHLENLRSVWESAKSEHTPKIETAKVAKASSDKNENHLTENRELMEKSKDVDITINPFLKTSVSIFIFLAIVISLFPPI